MALCVGSLVFAVVRKSQPRPRPGKSRMKKMTLSNQYRILIGKSLGLESSSYARLQADFPPTLCQSVCKETSHCYRRAANTRATQDPSHCILLLAKPSIFGTALPLTIANSRLRRGGRNKSNPFLSFAVRGRLIVVAF